MVERTEFEKLVTGDKVIYKGEMYSIIHIYKSGYIEIKKDQFNVQLVHYSEIKKMA